MFTIEQIELAHSKVKSGAEFPKYIAEIKEIGVKSFETWVFDSHTSFFGKTGFQTKSKPKYDNMPIAKKSDKHRFTQYLKMHQNGDTDYFTFCKHSAETGIEKWIADLDKMTCTYYDMAGNEILIEKVPTL